MGTAGKPDIYLALGSHLDLFWLGTHRECLERGLLISRRALDLLEQHPRYHYYIETALFAEYHLRRCPADQARMQVLLDAGRLEIGASFVDRVEHSHHGESLIRQAQEGIAWQERTFGRLARTAMHPDLPGMSPQVPQIYARAGIEAYLRARGFGAVYTWQAPDGSHILYCNLFGYGEKTLDALEALLAEDISAEAVLVRAGYGDLQMPDERVLGHLQALHARHPERRIHLATPAQLVGTLRSQPLPALSGEMPYGWGSLASAFVRIMAQSVALEHLLLTAEKLQALAAGYERHISLAPPPRAPHIGWDYTAIGRIEGDIWGEPIAVGDELHQLWRYELLCQDHNYGGKHGAQSNWDREMLRSHAMRESQRIIDLYLRALAGSTGDRFVLFNPLSWEYGELVHIADEAPHTLQALDEDGQPLPVQADAAGLWIKPRLEPWQVRTIRLVRGEMRAAAEPQSAVLEGGGLRAEIDAAGGCIASLREAVSGRELLDQAGPHRLGELLAYRDTGMDVRYSTSPKARSDRDGGWQVAAREEGALCAHIRLEGTFLHCRAEKTITLHKDEARLDIGLRLWWWGKHGEHLRLCFPLNPAGHHATWYGVPFYAMRWPEMLQGAGVTDDMILEQGLTTDDMLLPDDRLHHREVIGWLEAGYAEHRVTIGTRSTSWWIDGANLQAALLRTQWSCGDVNLWNENPGEHNWEFSLRPHRGDWRAARAWRCGEEMLNPPAALRLSATDIPDSDPRQVATPGLTPGNVQVTAFLQSGRSPGTLLIRLLESEGSPCTAELRLPFAVSGAEAVDLLERSAGPVEIRGGVLRVPLSAWQFQTVRIKLKGDTSDG